MRINQLIINSNLSKIEILPACLEGNYGVTETVQENSPVHNMVCLGLRARQLITCFARLSAFSSALLFCGCSFPGSAPSSSRPGAPATSPVPLPLNCLSPDSFAATCLSVFGCFSTLGFPSFWESPFSCFSRFCSCSLFCCFSSVCFSPFCFSVFSCLSPFPPFRFPLFFFLADLGCFN